VGQEIQLAVDSGRTTLDESADIWAAGVVWLFRGDEDPGCAIGKAAFDLCLI